MFQATIGDNSLLGGSVSNSELVKAGGGWAAPRHPKLNLTATRHGDGDIDHTPQPRALQWRAHRAYGFETTRRSA